MKPLLFILAITGLSILVSCYSSAEVTWFTYYVGGMVGLLVSSVALGWWDKRKKAQEEEAAAKDRTKRKF